MSAGLERAGAALRLGAAGVILWAAFVRAMLVVPRLPHWDSDPLLAWVPETTLRPSLSLWLDALVWLAVGAGLAGERLAGRRVGWFGPGAVVLGALFALAHGWFLTPVGGAPGVVRGDAAALTLGSVWVTAIAGAWAMALLARDARVRAAATAGVMGFLCLLLVKGAHQVLVDHARTVARFEADPVTAFRAASLEPGSAAARVWERRLRQPEATGWFGLANVYGTFAAFGLAAWAGAMWAAFRAGARWVAVVACLGAVAAAWALVLSGSKGAMGAAAVGLGAFALGAWLARGRGVGRCVAWGLALAAPLAVSIGVALRGAVGERLGELSLLFRWHYLQGAARIWAGEPVLGVGPGGFKTAYALAKPEANPEQVASPHSTLVDLACGLGVGGLALAAVWVVLVAWTGGAVFGSPAGGAEDDAPGSGASDDGGRTWLVGLFAVLVAAVTAWTIDLPVTSRGESLTRFVGLVLAIGVVRLWSRLGTASPRLIGVGFGAGGIALAAHGQIEMTGVFAGSAALAALTLGLAASPGIPAGRESGRVSGRLAWATLGACPLVAGVLGAGAIRAGAWELGLERAAAVCRADAAREAVDAETMRRAAAELERAASDRWVGPETASRAARLWAFASRLEARSGPAGVDPARSDLDASVEALRGVVEAWPGRAVGWSLLGRALWERGRTFDRAEDLDEAIEATAEASALSPWSLVAPSRLALWNSELGRADDAGRWAARALRVDESLRLDPLVRLDGAERRRLEALAEGNPAPEASGSASR